MTNICLDPKITDEVRRKHIFEGSILLFSPTAVTLELCKFAKQMIEKAFNSNDPQNAQHSMKVEDFVSIVDPLKSKFTNDEHTKLLVRKILSEFGCDLNKTYFDVPRLRVVTHGGYLTSGVGYAYKAHRDTWYSSPPSQINWWMSIYPLEADQSLALYPNFWNRPIKNSSNEFNYDEWCNVGRKQAASQIKTDTRKHPLPQEELSAEEEIRLVTRTAQPILFSAAHLHATVPNNSGHTRFSIDFRTICYDDLLSKHGAQNIDCSSKGTTLGDFLLASDYSPISKDLIC